MSNENKENVVIGEQEVRFTPDEMLDTIKGMWSGLRSLESEKAVEEWFLSRSESELSRLYAAAAALHRISAMMEHDLQKAYGMKTGRGIQVDGLAGEDGALIVGHGQRPGKDVLSTLFGGDNKPKQVA